MPHKVDAAIDIAEEGKEGPPKEVDPMFDTPEPNLPEKRDTKVCEALCEGSGEPLNCQFECVFGIGRPLTPSTPWPTSTSTPVA